MVKYENPKFKDKLVKVVIFTLLLVIFLSSISLFISKLGDVYYDFKSRSKWLYGGGIDPGPYKYVKVKFVRKKDWDYINDISIFDKLYVIDNNIYYDTNYINNTNQFYPPYNFIPIYFVSNQKRLLLAIKPNQEAIIVSRGNSLSEYCNQINTLLSKNFSFSNLSNTGKKRFLYMHLKNIYDDCYILDKNKLIKYKNIDNPKKDGWINQAIETLSQEEYKLIIKELSNKTTSNDETSIIFRYLVLNQNMDGKITPVISTFKVKDNGSIMISDKSFASREWLFRKKTR